MKIQRKQSPITRKRAQEHLEPEDFVTSSVEEVEAGANIVLKTMFLYTILLMTLAFFVALLVCLFVFPELRKDLLSILERLIGGLWQLL